MSARKEARRIAPRHTSRPARAAQLLNKCFRIGTKLCPHAFCKHEGGDADLGKIWTEKGQYGVKLRNNPNIDRSLSKFARIGKRMARPIARTTNWEVSFEDLFQEECNSRPTAYSAGAIWWDLFGQMFGPPAARSARTFSVFCHSGIGSSSAASRIHKPDRANTCRGPPSCDAGDRIQSRVQGNLPKPEIHRKIMGPRGCS